MKEAILVGLVLPYPGSAEAYRAICLLILPFLLPAPGQALGFSSGHASGYSLVPLLPVAFSPTDSLFLLLVDVQLLGDLRNLVIRGVRLATRLAIVTIGVTRVTTSVTIGLITILTPGSLAT